MKTPIKRSNNRQYRWLRYASLAFAPLAIAGAQDSGEDEEIFELSPFEVSSSDASGYRANSTLAGSRLNTELKDVAASVTVLTSEFLDDLGATDIETAFSYIAGVETALNSDTSERGTSGALEDSVINTQPGNNRVRGLASATVTRDFFEIGNGNIDRYNIDRLDLVRGPNSILFGLGSPAGIINYTSKKATLGTDINEISVTLDSFGSRRATFDFNRTVGDRFAIRLLKLAENTKSQYETSFDKDERLMVSLVAKPFEKTTLRYNFEITDNDARRPNYSLPIDNVSHWIASGRPIWDIREPANVGVFPAENFPGGPSDNPNPASPATLNGGVEEFNSPFPFTNIQLFIPGTDNPTVPFITTKAGTGFRQTPAGGGFPEVNLQVDGTERVLARSRSALDLVDNFIDVSVTDPRIFPIFDINLAALPGNSQSTEATTHHLTWTQKVTNDFHFEINTFKDNTQTLNLSRFNGADRAVAIDLNPVLLDGVTANPGYLRPFISGRGGINQRETNMEATRLSMAYDLDFADVSDKLGFLGRHIFSGSLFDSKRTDTSAGGSPSSVYSDDIETFGINRSIYGSWVFQNWYLGDPFTEDQAFPNYTTFTTQEIDPSAPISVYRATNGASAADPLVWSFADPVETGTRFANASWSDLDVEGKGITWQGYLWNDKIVGTLGFREDTVASRSSNQLRDEFSLVDPSNPEIWGPELHELNALAQGIDPNFEETGSTSSKGIVFHPTNWLSVFYNESDNFEVGPTRVYPTLQAIPNPSGVGQDVGFSIRTLDGKLELKLNRFESSQKNVSGRGSLASTAQFGVNTYERFVWATIRNFRNNRLADGTFDNGGTYSFRGQELSQAEFEEFFRYAWYDPTAADRVGPPTEARYFAPSNSDDTVDVDATGYELELTYNPTKNWRIAFNGTKTQTIQDNIGPGFNEYVEARLPIWSKTWGDLQLDGDGNIVGSSNGVRFQDRASNNLMFQEYLNRVVAAQNTAAAGEGRINVGLAEYAANLVTNYSFKDGKYKGLSFGANLRWREGAAVGYPIIQTPDGPASDLANPFISDSTLNVGINASYRKKIFDDSVTWISRLQINNLVGDDDIVLSAVNPDGTPAAYRAGRESFVQWTNTFKF